MKKRFSGAAREPLTNIVKSIVSLIATEKIFLLSVVYQEEKLESIFFQADFAEQAVKSFLLLVLAAESETRPADQLQDMVEHCAGPMPGITAFVFPVQHFNSWLMKNHPFAGKVYHEAYLFYDAGTVPLAIPDAYAELTVKEIAQKRPGNYIERAMEFISGAVFFSSKKQYALAAFQLHQAAEQLYSGTILLLTGLRVHTHNLDKLYRYASHISPGIQTIFPRYPRPEQELFRCLQRAYTDGRYNNDFMPTSSIIAELSDRVQKLLALCKTLSHSKIINT